MSLQSLVAATASVLSLSEAATVAAEEATAAAKLATVHAQAALAAAKLAVEIDQKLKMKKDIENNSLNETTSTAESRSSTKNIKDLIANDDIKKEPQTPMQEKENGES